MIFDATVSRDGKTSRVRGNQMHLDKLIEEGYQIIDKLPLITHRTNLPKDRDNEEVRINVADCNSVVTSGL